MALIKCPECRKKVSDKCGKCPYCGCPIENCDESNKPENAVTSKKPINKKLLSGIVLVFVALAILGGIVAYNALLPKINATKDFNAAVHFVEEKNRKLEAEISRSENLVLQKMPLLDEGHLLALENAISDAKAAKITDFKTPNSTDDIIARTAELNNVDYSEVIGKLKEKHTAFEIDAKRYQLVNVPTEAYVIQCLQTIPEIKGISAVTEDNDPNGNLNKLGGYTATVYFSHEKIELDKTIYGETIIEQGTDGGGAIEVYTCVEDAIKRRDYLAVFDGTITASGTHTVIGTVLVRTSDKLTASQQKDFEAKLIAALTYIEEVDGEKEPSIEERPAESTTVEIPTEPIEETKPTTSTNNKPSSDDTEYSEEEKKQNAIEYVEVFAGQGKSPGEIKEGAKTYSAYTTEEIEYGIEHANIDWKSGAIEKLEEYLGDAKRNNKAITKADCKSFLSSKHEYSSSVVQYALEKANVDWADVAADYISNFKYKTIKYTHCSTCGDIYGIYESCPFCDGEVDVWHTFGHTKSEVINMLKGFSDSEINAALKNFDDRYFYDESEYRKP